MIQHFVLSHLWHFEKLGVPLYCISWNVRFKSKLNQAKQVLLSKGDLLEMVILSM